MRCVIKQVESPFFLNRTTTKTKTALTPMPMMRAISHHWTPTLKTTRVAVVVTGMETAVVANTTMMTTTRRRRTGMPKRSLLLRALWTPTSRRARTGRNWSERPSEVFFVLIFFLLFIKLSASAVVFLCVYRGPKARA